MPKLTLLEMTQNILSAMDSDDVNSITDTVESAQVAEVIKETYFDLIANLDIPEHLKPIQLNPISSTYPNYMTIPDNVQKIKWIKYDWVENNESGDYKDVQYLDPEEFIELSIQRTPSVSHTRILDPTANVSLLIQNNKNPQYWTTFDDYRIVFDSYLSSVDTTLQASKTLCWARIDPDWTASDDFVPLLDANLFPLLLSEAKSVCFVNQKQVSSAKEEQRSKRSLTRMQNDLWRADQRRPYNRLPDYGRRR